MPRPPPLPLAWTLSRRLWGRGRSPGASTATPATAATAGSPPLCIVGARAGRGVGHAPSVTRPPPPPTHRHCASDRGVARERRRPHPGRPPSVGSSRPCCRAGLVSMEASWPIAVGRSPPLRAGRVRVPPNKEGGSRPPYGSCSCGAPRPPSRPPLPFAALTTGHTSRRAPPLPIPAQDSRAALPAEGGGWGTWHPVESVLSRGGGESRASTRLPRLRPGQLPRLGVLWPPPPALTPTTANPSAPLRATDVARQRGRWRRAPRGGRGAGPEAMTLARCRTADGGSRTTRVAHVPRTCTRLFFVNRTLFVGAVQKKPLEDA